jgi:hypothetical protein
VHSGATVKHSDIGSAVILSWWKIAKPQQVLVPHHHHQSLSSVSLTGYMRHMSAVVAQYLPLFCVSVFETLPPARGRTSCTGLTYVACLSLVVSSHGWPVQNATTPPTSILLSRTHNAQQILELSRGREPISISSVVKWASCIRVAEDVGPIELSVSVAVGSAQTKAKERRRRRRTSESSYLVAWDAVNECSISQHRKCFLSNLKHPNLAQGRCRAAV